MPFRYGQGFVQRLNDQSEPVGARVPVKMVLVTDDDPPALCAPLTPLYNLVGANSDRRPLMTAWSRFSFGSIATDSTDVDPDEDVPLFNKMPDAVKNTDTVFGSEEWKNDQRNIAGLSSYEDDGSARHNADVRIARMKREMARDTSVDDLLAEMEHLGVTMRLEDRERRDRAALGLVRSGTDLARNDFKIFYEEFTGFTDLARGEIRIMPRNRAERRPTAKGRTKPRRGPVMTQPSCHHGNLKGSCRQCW